MKTSVMKRIDFCAGHRLVGHGGKCEHFHGHNYKLEVFVSAEELDHLGRVVDFAELRDLFKSWIDEHWDHGFVLADDDENGISAIRSVQPHRLFLLPYSPTAENMARFLLDNVAPQLCNRSHRGVTVDKIVLWESDSSCAIVSTNQSTTTVDSILQSEYKTV